MALNLVQLFNEYGHYVGPEIPAECVAECSKGGRDATPYVRKWREQLGFNVPWDLSPPYLLASGFSQDDLRALLTNEMSERVLWLACCDLRERGEWLGCCE